MHTHKMSDRLVKLFSSIQSMPPLRMGIVCPDSENALLGVFLAAEAKIISPILYGDLDKMRALSERLGRDITAYECVDGDTDTALNGAITAAKQGTVKSLMKGNLHTAHFLEAVVAKENELRTGRRMGHTMLIDSPHYHKLIIYSDAAFNILPTGKTRGDILMNAVDLAHALGVKQPKIALLSALEKVSDQMPSTEDCVAVRDLVTPILGDTAIVEGPLSFDVAISKEAAHIKGVDSNIAGDTDVFIFPNIEAANVAVKQIEFLGGATCFGIALGARVPIALTSRSENAESRMGACLLAAYYAHYHNVGEQA